MCRVFILSGIPFYREGLARLLGETAGITVVECTAPESLALQRALLLSPDMVLVDISSREGIDAIHWFADHAGHVSVVALAVADRETDVYECARAGVAGYVTRDASLKDLVDTLTGVARGELRCPPPLSSILRRHLARADAAFPVDANDIRLTVREREILRLMQQDLSNKEIARRLTIEVSTVKSHVHNILEKLRVHRRAEAVTRHDVARPQGAGRHPAP